MSIAIPAAPPGRGHCRAVVPIAIRPIVCTVRRMCGRVAIFFTWAEVFEAMSLTPPADLPDFDERFNIAPTVPVWILRPDEGGALAPERARWGLIPSWWSKDKAPGSTHNAKAERLTESGMWRRPFEKQRCVMPISGFYEWKTVTEAPATDLLGEPVGKPKKVKKPFYISRKDGRPLLLAAIWDIGPDPATGEPRLSVANITCEPGDWMSQYHDRSPVILEPEDVGRWIEEGGDDLLRPPNREIMQAWPVKTAVGNVAYQAPDAVEPVDV